MKITVTFYFGLADLFGGQSPMRVEPGMTLRQLLRTLCTSDERRNVLYDDRLGESHPLVMILRNGQSVSRLDTVLEDGDWIDIFPVLGGG